MQTDAANNVIIAYNIFQRIIRNKNNMTEKYHLTPTLKNISTYRLSQSFQFKLLSN